MPKVREPTYTPEKRECLKAGALHQLSLIMGVFSPIWILSQQGLDAILLPLLEILARALSRLPLGALSAASGRVADRAVLAARAPAQPFLHWHARQSLRFNLAYLAITLATCGLGGLVLLPFFVSACLRAARGAREGEWTALAWIGVREPPRGE